MRPASPCLSVFNVASSPGDAATPEEMASSDCEPRMVAAGAMSVRKYTAVPTAERHEMKPCQPRKWPP